MPMPLFDRGSITERTMPVSPNPNGPTQIPANKIDATSMLKHEIGHGVIQDRLLALPFVQRLHQRERLIALPTQRPHGLAVQLEHGRLRASECRRQHTFVSVDRDVEREVMPAKLKHPGAGR